MKRIITIMLLLIATNLMAKPYVVAGFLPTLRSFLHDTQKPSDKKNIQKMKECLKKHDFDFCMRR